MTRTGSLVIVGIGPGARALMTDQAREALRRAQVIVGYWGYFDGLADLLDGKECLALPLGAERERAQRAVERARAGEAVCVISSGDAGIYGMASLVLETLEAAGGVSDVDVAIVPGVSAVNACAALLGAPLGHDFAVVSLSDLLTPWPQIERRLIATAEADFVLALLNPKSTRRDWQLRCAGEILLQHRRPETPVGIVRQAYRPGQSVEITTLGRMTETAIDMFTTVIVGNSQTRRFADKLVTPRGYSSHRDSPTFRRAAEGHCRVGRVFEAHQGRVVGLEDSAHPTTTTTADIALMTLRKRGEEITTESFRIIEREIGEHNIASAEWQVVRRMIHACGDMDLAQLVCFRRGAVAAGIEALRQGTPVVTDVRMVAVGLNKAALKSLNIDAYCFLDDPEVEHQAAVEGRTRSACAMEKALATLPRAVYVVGSAPTALLALCAGIRRGAVQPRLVIAAPVGFVAVQESKEQAFALDIPLIGVRGRKGGSAVAAAALNALLIMAAEEQR